MLIMMRLKVMKVEGGVREVPAMRTLMDIDPFVFGLSLTSLKMGQSLIFPIKSHTGKNRGFSFK